MHPPRSPWPQQLVATLPLNVVLRQLIVIVTILVSFLIAAFGRDFLPSTFYNDDALIQRFMDSSTPLDEGSFWLTATFYNVVGLNDQETLVAILAVTCFAGTVFIVNPWRYISTAPVLQVAIFCSAILLSAIYLGQYTKELMVVLLIAALFIFPVGKKFELLWLTLAVAYAYFVRDYWYLVLVLYLGARLLLRRRRSVLFLVSSCMLAVTMIGLLFYYLLDLPLNFYRISVQDYLDAATLLVDPLLAESLGGQLLNGYLILFTLWLPWPLFAVGGLIYAGVAIYIAVIWIYLFASVRPRHQSRRLVWSRRVRQSLSLLLAFVVVQSIFEPDYGSYIKHLVPLLPLLLYVLRESTVARAWPARVTSELECHPEQAR